MANDYTVTFGLAAESLDDAFKLATAKMAAAGLVSPITVTGAPVKPVTRVWSVQMSGDRKFSPRRDVLVLFSGDLGRGKVVITDDALEPQSCSITLSAASMAELVRTVQQWPLDLMETMASDDLRRRGGGGA